MSILYGAWTTYSWRLSKGVPNLIRNPITFAPKNYGNYWTQGCSSCFKNVCTGQPIIGRSSVFLQNSNKLIGVQNTALRTTKFQIFTRIAGRRNLNTSFIRSQMSNVKKGDKDLPPARKAGKKEISRLLGLAKGEKWTLTGAILLLVVSSTVTMAVPFCLGKVIDIIYTGDDLAQTKKNLDKVCLGLLGVFIIGGLCNFGRVYLMQTSGLRITNKMRTSVFSSILKQDIAFFDKNKTGELINRLSADTSLVSQSVTMNVSDGLRSTFLVAAGVSMMIYTSPQLAIVGLSVVPPIAGLAVVYGRYVRKITTKVQDSLASATQVAEERISNIRTVRAFSQESLENQAYENKISDVLKLSYKEALARGIFFGMTGLSGNFIILSVLYYGGSLVAENSITVGALSAFLLYAAYVGVAIGGLSSFYSEMMKGLGASTRLWELIDTTPTIPLKGGLIPSAGIAGHIQLNDVSFAYPNRTDALIFNKVNLDIPAGSIVAIVGSSGSGKSTLGSLLLRFYDPISGSISIDGNDIAKMDPNWLRLSIGTVSQEPILFSSSVKENILYGAINPETIPEERIWEVAHEANAYDFIMKFPQRFDTMVGERGVMLSGGQRQRIAIARALMKNPKILLFDEATSALDAESEHLVQEALERVAKNRTVITIAHRLSTIRNADKIAVLNEGQFAEVGAYHELMTIQDGMFRRLVEKQTIQQ